MLLELITYPTFRPPGTRWRHKAPSRSRLRCTACRRSPSPPRRPWSWSCVRSRRSWSSWTTRTTSCRRSPGDTCSRSSPWCPSRSGRKTCYPCFMRKKIEINAKKCLFKYFSCHSFHDKRKMCSNIPLAMGYGHYRFPFFRDWLLEPNSPIYEAHTNIGGKVITGWNTFVVNMPVIP